MLCSSLKPYDINILDIEKGFFKEKRKEFDETKKWCTKKCFASCIYSSSYIIEHPIKTLLE